MPTNPHTLSRQVAPLHTGQAAAEVAARQYNNGPLTDGEKAAVNEAAAWDYRDNGLDYQSRYPFAAECGTDVGSDDDRPPMTVGDAWIAVALVAACAAVWAMLFWELS